MNSVSITVPRSVAKRIQEEAEKLGVSVEEYLLELVTQGLNPKERAVEYVKAAEEFLREARAELGKGNVRQAAEKVWGVAALAVKAYTYWREGKRLASHGELWEYSGRLAEELGEWVDDAWNQANSMHTCFYEGWCLKRHVESALKQVEKLVKEVASRIKKGNS